MKTDIQIAQEAEMLHIREVAAKVGIEEEDLEFYGKYKAKLSDELMERVKDRPDGKLVLVTAINPTPAGEGKTTITVGLGEAMAKLGNSEHIKLIRKTKEIIACRLMKPYAITTRIIVHISLKIPAAVIAFRFHFPATSILKIICSPGRI